MIDFRYHLVSLVAVFLALAIGIVLGSGPLEEPIQGTLKSQADALKRDSDKLRAENAAQARQLSAADKFTGEVMKAMVPNQLAARTVVVVSLPGVGKSQVSSVTKVLGDAGATVLGTVSLSDKYVDPKNSAALEDLALRLVPPGVTFVDNATPMDRVDTVLAAALVVDDASRAGKVNTASAEVLAGLADFGALSTSGDPTKRAELSVVLAPAAPKTQTAATDAVTAALQPLPLRLDARARGVVLAGATGSDDKGGLVAVLRGAGNARKGLTTVDDIDTTNGLLAAVLALVEQTRQAFGDYGTGGNADAAIPDLSASTR